jgi:hypothetical protein
MYRIFNSGWLKQERFSCDSSGTHKNRKQKFLLQDIIFCLFQAICGVTIPAHLLVLHWEQ